MSRARLGDQNEEIARLLRIDHSDVYLFNDKLDEDLVTDLDVIHRERHRHKIALDYEIAQLRRACAANKANSIRGRGGRKSAAAVRAVSRQSSVHTFYASQRPVAASPSKQTRKVEEADPAVNSSPPSNQQLRGGSAGMGKGRPPSYPSERVKKKNDDSEEESSSESDNYDDSDDDDTSDTDSWDNSNEGIDGGQDRGLRSAPAGVSRSKPLVRQHSTVGQQGTQSATVGRLRERNKDNCSNSFMKKEKKADLQTNLWILRLDQAPAHWYTSVVKARDVRVGSAQAARPKRRRRPHFTSAMGRRNIQQAQPIPKHQHKKLQWSEETQKPKNVWNKREPEENGSRDNSRQRLTKSAVQSRGIEDVQNKENWTKGKQAPQRPSTSNNAGRSVRELRALTQDEEEQIDGAQGGSYNPLRAYYQQALAEKGIINERVKAFLRSLEELKSAEKKKDILQNLLSNSRLL